jgi:hypothetical protein
MLKSIFTIIISAMISISAMSQDRALALAAADSSNFSVNSKEGWLLYNSCLTSLKSDSILLELILQHDRNISWESEQLVGKIKTSSYFPRYGQTVGFNLLLNNYKLRIDNNGKCFLRLDVGSLPDDADSVIIPVRAYYKK